MDYSKILQEKILPKTSRHGECLEWTGPVNGGPSKGGGYGSVYCGARKSLGVHVVAFAAEHGFIPPVVMHTCDNRRCVRIDHLKAGTTKLNQQDMVAKGRSRTGIKHHNVKLTEEQVLEIRNRFKFRDKNGNNGRDLAKEFGVGFKAISKIVSNKRWKRIGNEHE